MKIIVTGSNGQLGSDVVKELKNRGITPIEADLPQLDITNELAVNEFFAATKPDAVIHCAAYTNVDMAETEREICASVNINGTKNIANACKKFDTKLLYTSTDYVFDGKGEAFFETDSPVAPCNFYGYSKLEGEKAITNCCEKYFIVRISWVFGMGGKNFVKTMLRLSETRDSISVVCDQIGSPTFTPDLSVLLCDMIVTEKYGVYHATNEGICSWAEFAEEIMKLCKKETKIIRIPTSEYPSPAARPFNSRLSKLSLDENGFSRLPSWQNALERFLKEYLK